MVKKGIEANILESYNIAIITNNFYQIRMAATLTKDQERNNLTGNSFENPDAEDGLLTLENINI